MVESNQSPTAAAASQEESKAQVFTKFMESVKSQSIVQDEEGA